MIFKQLARRGHNFPPLDQEFEDRLVIVNGENKDELEKALTARIIETPGHTVCSLSLLRDDGILFCGDAAMNGFPSSHRAAICIDYPDQFCKSWDRIIALKPKKIYPGHGRPFPVSDLEKNLNRVRQMKLYQLS
jgi:glyoxylase-like metal-dependent hydrolase (beta-lactamase superfamily II)